MKSFIKAYRMKLSLFLISIVLFYIIDAASLKRFSEELSIIDGKDDSTKEKVPNDELIISELYGIRNDGEVSELNNLKFMTEKNQFKDTKHLDEKLENSLKKLHNSNMKGSKFSKNINHDKINKKYLQKESLNSYSVPNEKFELTTENNKFSYLTKNESLKSIRNPYVMLRDSSGKYSAYEIAQYIFWTGDEAGIANAVEELIDEELMGRENAVKFLNDVRLGINYLENKYKTGGNRNVPTEKTTTEEYSIGEDIPFNYNAMKARHMSKISFQDKMKSENYEKATVSSSVVKALDKIPSLLKLAKIHRDNKNKLQSKNDENEGRAHLKDFLLEEYSLEEIIYQLAKTMFMQSLTNGSEDSQTALQKLTQFLENEGKHGRISPMLQKKILDVLLAALSDSLSENPEILKNTHLVRSE